jgi:hypothetical protein
MRIATSYCLRKTSILIVGNMRFSLGFVDRRLPRRGAEEAKPSSAKRRKLGTGG